MSLASHTVGWSIVRSSRRGRGSRPRVCVFVCFFAALSISRNCQRHLQQLQSLLFTPLHSNMMQCELSSMNNYNRILFKLVRAVQHLLLQFNSSQTEVVGKTASASKRKALKPRYVGVVISLYFNFIYLCYFLLFSCSLLL